MAGSQQKRFHSVLTRKAFSSESRRRVQTEVMRMKTQWDPPWSLSMKESFGVSCDP
jgi:hypothetical protein